MPPMPEPQQQLITLVRFTCGCVGFPPISARPKQAWACIVLPCDGTDGDPEFGTRDMTGKGHALLDGVETMAIFGQIQKALNRGRAYQDLRAALRHMVRDEA